MALFQVPEEAYERIEAGWDRRTGLDNAAPYIAHAAIRGLAGVRPNKMVEWFDLGVRGLDLLAYMVLLVWVPLASVRWLVTVVLVVRLLSIVVDKVWWKTVRRRAGVLSRRDVQDFR